MMSVCGKCRHDNPSDAKFCISCGAPMPPAPIESDDEIDFASLKTVSGLVTEPGFNHTNGQRNDAPARQGFEPGDIVADKYRIEKIIGMGGMGVVYKAEELLTSATVALKVINPDSVASPKAVDRLIEEGVNTRQIAHPNIVRMNDIGLTGDQPYIAMEYIDGVPLHIWRGKHISEKVSIRVIVAIVNEILDGLEAAHRAGVIHRDLKPENILLIGEPGETSVKLKIVDFGIALAAKAKADAGTGTGLGTQLYMAPEQIRNANAANETADLYSLSKIFYELIVGVLPTGHWQPPSDGRADIAKGIDALIAKGLSANRDNRPQNAAEYRQLLSMAYTGKQLKPHEEHAEKLRATYVDYFKSLPKWQLVVVAIILLVILIASMSEDDFSGGPSDDYYSEEQDPAERNADAAFAAALEEAMALEETVADEREDREDETEDAAPPPPAPIVKPKTRQTASLIDGAYFSGPWHDGLGGVYNITTGDDGAFSGSGALANGAPAKLSGRIYSDHVEYSLTSRGQQIISGASPRSDKCHFTYQVQNPFGLLETRSFCMNHTPGQPCP